MRAFQTVADEQSFTRAARRLNMTQPPLTERIKELEAALGIRLFNRTTRSVSLTVAGAVFRREVDHVIEALNHAVAAARQADGGLSGTLRIGYTGGVNYVLMPHILRNFRAEFPGITLDLRGPQPSGTLNRLLNEREIDVALCFLPMEGPNVQWDPLLESPLTAVLHERHPLAEQRTIDLADLKAESFVCYPDNSGFPSKLALVAACEKAGFRPVAVQESNAALSILCLVAAGTGVAILPQDSVRMRIPGVAFRTLRPSIGALRHGIAWNGEASFAALDSFIAIAKKVAEDLQDDIAAERHQPEPLSRVVRRAQPQPIRTPAE